MPIVTLLLIVALIGFAAWLVATLIPMSPNIVNLIYVTAFIIALLVVLNAFGILGAVHLGNVPRVR